MFSILKYFTVTPVLFIIFSCNSGTKDRGDQKTSSFSKPPSSYADTFTIDRASFVFYFPDTMQLEKIRSATDPDIFDATMHEYEYLVKNARNVISQSSFMDTVYTLEVRNARYLLFRGILADSCIDLDTRGEPIGVFLFKPSGSPQAIDLPNVASELPAYFIGFPEIDTPLVHE